MKNIEDEINKSLIEKNKLLFLAKEVDLDSKNMKDLAFLIGKNKNNLFLVLASNKGGKPIISCYISKELVNKKDINAIDVVNLFRQTYRRFWGWSNLFRYFGWKKSQRDKKKH